MPREYDIKWTANQRKRLDSAVRRYNNAVRRAERNPLLPQFLPDEVRYKDLKASITNRRALNNTVNRLLRATRKGAFDLLRLESGDIVTRYERREAQILHAVNERRKAGEARRKGIDTSKPVETLAEAAAHPSKMPQTKKGIERFIKNMSRRLYASDLDRMRRWKANYMKAMDSVFGGFSEFDERVQFLSSAIDSAFENGFAVFEEAMNKAPDIKYIYDPITRKVKMETIFEYWARYADAGSY